MIASLVVFAVVVLVLLWFCCGGRSDAPEPTAHRQPVEDIDYTELENAEREVQEAPDEDGVRDWGPGVQKPPLG